MGFPIIFGIFEVIYNFPYIGSAQNMSHDPGYYKLEVWGAQGSSGGKGGYSAGYLNLTETTNFYVQVGGSRGERAGAWLQGGYNGGGGAIFEYKHANYLSERVVKYISYYGNCGGGGTDIRINENSIYSRVIVAGGGGGSHSEYYGGGYAGGGNFPAKQNSTSGAGDFFQGATAPCAAGGGGGGWFGGGTCRGTQQFPPPDNVRDGCCADSGGSGYVYKASTAEFYPSGCKLTPKYYLHDTEMLAGNNQFKEPNGTISTGHVGNGYARITFFHDNYDYILNGSELSVIGFNKNCFSVVEIRSSLNGNKIVSIANNSFKGHKCIQEVKLPETIREIGSSAFENCINLIKVSFISSSSIATIGTSVFKGCTKLNSIGFNSIKGNSIHILNLSYWHSLKSIPPFSFSDCSNIEEIHFSQELESIGDNAFKNCISLRYVNLPFNLKSVGKFCISGCVKLKQISIPCSLNKITSFAFCSSGIETVIINSNTVVDGFAFYNCSNLVIVEIFDNAFIMPNAFSLCTNIQNIVLYQYVTIFNNSFVDTISPAIFYTETTYSCYPNTEEWLKSIDCTSILVGDKYSFDKFCQISALKSNPDSAKFSSDLVTMFNTLALIFLTILAFIFLRKFLL